MASNDEATKGTGSETKRRVQVRVPVRKIGISYGSIASPEQARVAAIDIAPAYSNSKVEVSCLDFNEQGITETKRLLQPSRAQIKLEQQNSKGPPNANSSDSSCSSRFRYIICTVVLIGHALYAYANSTLFIAAIEMISYDVIENGLTSLRAKHMANDPLATSNNAAAEGTCPVDIEPYKISQWNRNDNVTALSEQERVAMLRDTVALFGDVQSRLANGKLVDWSINERGLVYTAQTVGVLALAVPLSRLGLAYGSKIIIMIGFGSSALHALLLPLVAGHTPLWFVITFEFLMGGLGHATSTVIYPLTAAWLLRDEASAFIPFFYLSGTIGDALTNLISTQMMANKIDWCWCFYIPGLLLIVVTIVWYILGADEPEKSKLVATGELMILKNSVANRNDSKKMEMIELGDFQCVCDDFSKKDYCNNRIYNDNSNSGSVRQGSPMREESKSCPARTIVRTPNWTVIFKCTTLWSLIAIHFSKHWRAKLVTLLPTFFANIIHISPADIGLLIGVEGAVNLVYGILFAFGTRKWAIRRPFNIQLTAYRRINQFLYILISTLSIALMTIFDCSPLMQLISAVLETAQNGFDMIGSQQLPLDLSPEDSGLIISYVRLISIGDIVALPVSSWILSFASNSIHGDRLTWRIVWLLCFAINVLACVIFLLFAKAEPKSYSRVEISGQCKSKQQLIEVDQRLHSVSG